MVYINKNEAKPRDWEMLKKWTKEEKTRAKATTDKNGNLQITTKD